MSWLFPGFLAGSVLIGLPVVLHLLRLKPRAMVRFPSLRFLGETALRDTRRHRLRRWLTMLLRCAAIFLLAAAFARPFLGDPGAPHNRAVVVAVDNSMSMQARGRWEECRGWALGELNQLGPGDEAAVMMMQPEPVWLVPMTDDIGRVRLALQSAQPAFEKTHYAKPLRLAAELLDRLPAATKTLVWMADEQLAGWRGADLAQKLPPGVGVRFARALPTPQRQAAIIALRPSTGAKAGLDATIRQFHSANDQRHLTVRAGDRVLAETDVALHAGDNLVSVVFQWPSDIAGLRASLDADDLAADDSAWIATARAATNTVLLDTVTNSDYLAHALRSTQKLTETGYQPVPLPDRVWPTDSVAILRNGAAFQDASLQKLNGFFDAGGPLWVFVDGSESQARWLKQHGIRVIARGTADEPWHLRDWDSEHPILSAFAGQSLLPLLEVEFYHGFDLSGDLLVSLANWPDGKTAIAELNSEGQRMLVAGFAADRAAMNWPTKPSFVPFVHQAVHWLRSVQDAHADWRVGDVIPLPDGQGTWRTLDSPVTQKDVSASGSVRPTAPGLYEFIRGDAKQIFAVNVPVEESDLTPWSDPDQLAALESKDTPAPQGRSAAATAGERATAENRQRVWWWLLAACGVTLVCELTLANRTSL